MINLSLKSKCVAFVINSPLNMPSVQLMKILGSKFNLLDFGGYTYYGLLHDSDKKEDSEELKTIHYHLIITADYSITLKSWLSFVSSLFELDENLFSIEPVRNLDKAVRYLSHADNPEKHSYNVLQGDSNRFDYMKRITLEIPQEEFNMNEFLDFLNSNPYVSTTELIMIYGAKFYMKYRLLIKDVQAEAQRKAFSAKLKSTKSSD